MTIYLFHIIDSNVGPYKLCSEYYIYTPIFVPLDLNKYNTNTICDTFGDVISNTNFKDRFPTNILDIKLNPDKHCIKHKNIVIYSILRAY